MPEQPSTAEIREPGFCPWCGAPSPYRPQEFTSRFEEAAREQGEEPPAAVKRALHSDAFVTGCPGCRRVTHVIGHPLGPHEH